MSRLAILGGQAAVRSPLERWPVHDEAEERALLSVVRSTDWWRGTGRQVERFERRFAFAHRAEAGLAVSNGTQALELALRCLDIGPGDEVIIPSLTFAATASAVFMVGARPVAVDVDPATWNLDPSGVEAAVGPRARAVMPVHFAGQIGDMSALAAICRRHDLALVEDAAHAHGARRLGQPAGSFGRMAAFSFQNFKLMTAGEGGILLFDDLQMAERASLMANCGRRLGSPAYRHELLGTNLRLSEFQGAVLNAQLDRLEELADLRTKNAEVMRSLLRGIEGIRLQGLDPEVDRHSFYMFAFELEPDLARGVGRDRFVEALTAEGVPAYRMYPRVQDTRFFSMLGGEQPKCPESLRLSRMAVSIHHNVLLSEQEALGQVAEAISKVCRQLHRLGTMEVSSANVIG